jgi:hydrogenase maturation protein HypF
MPPTKERACSIQVRGTVQGVGFRPFVFRLAHANHLAGWVLNAEQGVDIHIEGSERAVQGFVRDLSTKTPPAARIATIEVRSADPAGVTGFAIRESARGGPPTVHISPDLPICDACLRELFDPHDRRYRYPYINCTNCGPRYTIVNSLPYDRSNTTMQPWPMDAHCLSQFENPLDRRFHAQPVACSDCGPHFHLQAAGETVTGDLPSIRYAADLLRVGGIVALKGIGGYHLACDATNPAAVDALRFRKFRREKPFAVMAKTLEVARELIQLSDEAEQLLLSSARPIVVAPSKLELKGVAPDNRDLGVMLPYAPLHYLLFDEGAPQVLVMTSANKSNEPIVYRDADARAQLSGIADAFLIGDRSIARPVDDSIVRVGTLGAAILRRARGYAPSPVGSMPVARPLLALGGDLKNSIALVVEGQAFISQHLGDLEQCGAFDAFRQCVSDFVSMYEVQWRDLLVAHDLHPGYFSTSHALELPAAECMPIQHHRAHIASVLAERQAWDQRVIGVAFDGTGYGDDGAIWGGELFVGSIAEGFQRAAHVRYAALPGGDAAARNPLHSAAGFLNEVDCAGVEALFGSFSRYRDAGRVLATGMRTFQSSSIGRLFDTAAAILGFTRPIAFEGQAAMWVEHQAGAAAPSEPYPFPFTGKELDYRPLLRAAIEDRVRGRDIGAVARAFHNGIARGVGTAVLQLAEEMAVDTLVLSGGVFQNDLLLHELDSFLTGSRLRIWTNHVVPANDGGISLGQAAIAAFEHRRQKYA